MSAVDASVGYSVLAETLRVAVPLRIAELQQLPPAVRNRRVAKWAATAVDPIASQGDALQFGGERGQAASVFNSLARGLAALAHAPGGVTFADTHWCVEHSMGVNATIELTCGLSEDEQRVDTRARRERDGRSPYTRAGARVVPFGRLPRKDGMPDVDADIIDVDLPDEDQATDVSDPEE